jgi:hypothetical protein
MSLSRPIQMYHSHVDPIWPDGTFNYRFLIYLQHFQPYTITIYSEL